MPRIAVVDTETTGTTLGVHHVFEVALIVVDGKARTEKVWWMPVDLTTADPAALRINDYYKREVAAKDKSERAHVAREVARLTANAWLIGCVPSFDAGFLEQLLRENGLAPAWSYKPVCVETLIAGKLGLDLRRGDWPKSTELGQLVGVEPPTGEDRHTALGDCRWALAMYDAVMAQPKKRKPKAAPEPEAEPEAQPEAAEVEETPAPAPVASSKRPGPQPDDQHHCEDCARAGEETAIDFDQAQFSWTRWRALLCKECHAARKPN